ncbi:MAG: M28 family peptidase [Treponema sp.]|nr:M28 family peptidase [Treponema sp.]
MYQFPADFSDFISLSCDRLSFIRQYLNDNSINCKILQLGEKKHVYVDFPESQYNRSYKIKTLIAHYDRSGQTFGANDNSFAVYCLLEFAVKLFKKNEAHNVQIILTDGEETPPEPENPLKNINNVTRMGSYELAKVFKRLNIIRNDIYVFDCMGRGDIPVICENTFPENTNASLVNTVIALENRAEELVKKASGGKWFKLKTAFSDNAAFLANGIPCVQLTMLPSKEIDDYLHGIVPQTWRLLHTMDDNLLSLSCNSHDIFMKMLELISLNKTSSIL